MSSFQDAARGLAGDAKAAAGAASAKASGLGRKIPAKLKAKFDEAEAAMKAGEPAKAAEIFTAIAKKAKSKGKNGIAARVGMRAARAWMRAKEGGKAAAAMKASVAAASEAKNPAKLRARLEGFRDKLRAKGRTQAADALSKEIDGAFGAS